MNHFWNIQRQNDIKITRKFSTNLKTNAENEKGKVDWSK